MQTLHRGEIGLLHDLVDVGGRAGESVVDEPKEGFRRLGVALFLFSQLLHLQVLYNLAMLSCWDF